MTLPSQGPCSYLLTFLEMRAPPLLLAQGSLPLSPPFSLRLVSPGVPSSQGRAGLPEQQDCGLGTGPVGEESAEGTSLAPTQEFPPEPRYMWRSRAGCRGAGQLGSTGGGCLSELGFQGGTGLKWGGASGGGNPILFTLAAHLPDLFSRCSECVSNGCTHSFIHSLHHLV